MRAHCLLVLLIACGGDPAPFYVPPTMDGGNTDICTGTGIECVGDTMHVCEDGETQSREDCASDGRQCIPGRGCLVCLPGSVQCEGETVRVCNAAGDGHETGETCDVGAGLRCGPAGCVDLCTEAEASSSYIGCEYWPTPALNSQLPDEFEFAVVVANPQLVPARVVVTRGDAEQASVTVAPGDLATIRLPWVAELKNVINMERSSVVTDGSYRLNSDVPVTVYQFNPLEYRIDQDCAGETDAPDGVCYSFTNDASLLLPSHVLTGSYIALSRPTMLLELPADPGVARLGSPGYVTITAVEDDTTVEVLSRAFVAASGDGTVPALSPGGTTVVTLDRGDVLQLVTAVPDDCPSGWADEAGVAGVRYCDLGSDWDLTGSEIRASGPIAVIAGHNCTFVPFNRWACDHLEEAMFPVEAWGRDVLLGATQSLRREPNFIRIVSAADGNAITFEPPMATPTTLDRGGYIEMELSQAVRVRGTAALSVVQYLVGQDFAGLGSAGSFGAGDPSMSVAIPTEQLRTDYTFLAPGTYSESWVNITAPLAARVLLDGRLITDFTPIGDTGAGVARIQVRAGVHHMEAGQPFGVVVYGFGSYTSYMYPGGLDLREIAPPI